MILLFVARRLLFAVASALLLIAHIPAHAGGFQISETSVAGLGLAFAGAGITGRASDLSANPAGLMLRHGAPREMQFAAHIIAPSARYDERNSTLALRSQSSSSPLTSPLTGRESNGGKLATVPNFHYAADLSTSERPARYGFGITSPFGLTTQYDADWIGRYHAIKTSLITAEINPAVAITINDSLHLGGGLTFVTAEAELSQAQFLGPDMGDARAEVKGDATAFGYTFGIVGGGDDMRLGFGYRSRVKLKVDGDFTLGGARPVRSDAKAELVLPATIYLSGRKKLNGQWDGFASARWTDWSEFDELRVRFDNGLPDAVTPQNWRDSRTFGIGVRYRASEHSRWVLRFGYAGDETPIADAADLTPRIPDADREWFTFGGGYRASQRLRLDFAVAHLASDAVRTRQRVDLIAGMPGAAAAELNGEFNGEVNIVAVQVRYLIGR